MKTFADVTILFDAGEITVKGCRVLQNEHKNPWVAYPTTSYTKDGKRINKQIFESSRGLHRQIVEAVLAAYQTS
jgi:hypothetical protein